MTREEEIKEARHEWYLRTQDADFCAGFQKGAEWADAHPKQIEISLEDIEELAKEVIDEDWIERQDRLWNMIERNLRAQFIRKACEWLLEWETHQGEDIEVVKQFKQAMKGE